MTWLRIAASSSRTSLSPFSLSPTHLAIHIGRPHGKIVLPDSIPDRVINSHLGHTGSCESGGGCVLILLPVLGEGISQLIAFASLLKKTIRRPEKLGDFPFKYDYHIRLAHGVQGAEGGERDSGGWRGKFRTPHWFFQKELVRPLVIAGTTPAIIASLRWLTACPDLVQVMRMRLHRSNRLLGTCFASN